MGQGKKWSESEINYLKEHWGKNTLANLSTQLKRTKIAVNLKAKKTGLGAITRAGEYMTANQVSVLLNIDRHAVVIWIEKHNLRAKRKILLFKKLLWLIKCSDLCKWLRVIKIDSIAGRLNHLVLVMSLCGYRRKEEEIEDFPRIEIRNGLISKYKELLLILKIWNIKKLLY